MLGNTGRHINKPAQANFTQTPPKSHHRHPFAGVIAANPCRVIAVVGSEQDQVVVTHFAQQFGQATVEPFQRFRIARHIAPVAIKAVEFDKIGEGQRSIHRRIRQIQQMPHQRFVGTRAHLVNSVARENIADFSNSIDAPSCALNPVTQRRCRRCHRVIMAVGGADETLFFVAHKGARNRPAHVHFVQHRGQRFAQRIKPIQPKGFLMGRDLEHAVRRSITDRPTATHMLGPQIVNDRGARRMAVAQNAVHTGNPHHLGHQFGRK